MQLHRHGLTVADMGKVPQRNRLFLPFAADGHDGYADVITACGLAEGFPRHWNPLYNSLLNRDPSEIARRLRETAE